MLDAISAYHDLLSDAQLAADSQGMLDELLDSHGLVFGGRPLCTVLRPRLTSHERHAWLHQRVRLLMRVFARAYEAAIADARFRQQFMLADWEETLVQDDPGIRNPSPTSRLDTFIIDADAEMKLTEYNAETPAGAAYGDALTDAFIDLPVMRAFSRKYEIMPIPARQGILHVLLATYEEWLGRRELPRIAIVDWPDVPTVTEFEMYRDYFHSRGISCVIADPREAEMPPAGLVTLEDAETGQLRLVDTRSASFRSELAARSRTRQDALRDQLRATGMDMVVFDAAGSMVDPLLQFFRERERRLRR